METGGGTVDAGEARQHIASFDGARQAAHMASLVDAPSWFFPLASLLHPGLVWWGASFNPDAGATEQPILRVGATVMVTISVATLAFCALSQRKNVLVKGLPPIKGGRRTGTAFLFNASIIFPATIGINMTYVSDVYPPYLLSGLQYAWYLTIPPYLWRRHVQELRDRGAV